MKYFIRALQIMSIVSEWSVQAMEDGKVTAAEGFALIQRLAPVLGIDLEWELPDEPHR